MPNSSQVKRVALVTGAAQGLGRAIAERFSRDGMSVAMCDLKAGPLEDACHELTRSGVDAFPVVTDVSDEVSVTKMARAIEARYGRLDVVVNSAGILMLVNGRSAKFEETSSDLWNKVMAVNLTGTFLVCRHTVPLMRRNKWGRIVNISSRSARGRTNSDAAYTASKAGVLALTRVIANEFGRDGITANSIAPSRVPTALNAALSSPEIIVSKIAETPIGRLGTKEDITAVVSFLCSEEAGYITGVVIDVTGGSYMPS